MISTDDIVFTRLSGQSGDLGEIKLNRPQALNALTQDMCAQLANRLSDWEADDSIKAVVIRGEGDRAFCAGGDIRHIYDNGLGNGDSENFFRTEYLMNAMLFHFNKPYIALLDGITMGGGAGVSLHGSHRVGTERLMFAMPETGIGFFTDIGAGYFLPRCRDKLGFYLAFTGERINASDAQYLGLTTHSIISEQQPHLINELCATPFSDDPFLAVTKIIDRYQTENELARLSNYARATSDCFAGNTVEEVITRLEEVNNEWSLATLTAIKQRSPTSLKVTFEQLNRGGTMEFDDVMAMEYGIACQFIQTPDFFEGVRAALVDKDRSPKWQPDSLGEVTPEMVKTFFP